ncbi:MAG: hypothetical protein ACK58T_36965, partial [Phycisphaerae bacterium]
MLSLVGDSMPGFFLGVLMIYLFAIQLGWLQQRGIGAVATQSVERVPQVIDQQGKAATAQMIAN